MGLNWSDILYPGNPGRRDEVNKLAQSIRASVIEIQSNVRTVSISLNEANNKFQILPALDMNLTFRQVFQNIDDVLEQWKSVTEELELDPNIPQSIKDLMSKFDEATSVGQFPDTVKDITSDPSLAGKITTPIAGLIAGSIATYYIKLELATVISSSVKAVSAAGLLGGVIGMGVGVLVDIIIGAIEGAKEREKLEDLKKKYQEMDDNLRKNIGTLEKGVASVQRAIIKALPD